MSWGHLPIRSHETATTEGLFRTIDCTSLAIASAMRRVVHDYVSGWSIVLRQTPQERRRKKRVWNRRSTERHLFRRPVWISRARWSVDVTTGRRHVIVETQSDQQLVRDISVNGIGLSCDRAPRHRLVVLNFDCWECDPIELLVALRWRKRVAAGAFRCGGNVIGVLDRYSVRSLEAGGPLEVFDEAVSRES